MLLGFLLLVSPVLTLRTYSIPKQNSPPVSRQNARLCIDKQSNQLFLFGGMAEGGDLLNDLWAFDLESQKWARKAVISQVWPEARHSYGCFVDEVKRDLYIFGGETEKVVLNDLWAFSLTTLTVLLTQWTPKLSLGEVPPASSWFAYSRYEEGGLPKFAITCGQQMDAFYNSIYV